MPTLTIFSLTYKVPRRWARVYTVWFSILCCTCLWLLHPTGSCDHAYVAIGSDPHNICRLMFVCHHSTYILPLNPWWSTPSATCDGACGVFMQQLAYLLTSMHTCKQLHTCNIIALCDGEDGGSRMWQYGFVW